MSDGRIMGVSFNCTGGEPTLMLIHSGELTYSLVSAPGARLKGSRGFIITGRSASAGFNRILSPVFPSTKRSENSSVGNAFFSIVAVTEIIDVSFSAAVDH